MTIKKRTMPQYILLNCLTLGIYGFIVMKEVDNEINALCSGDGNQPKYSYSIAVLFRSISTIIGIFVGMIIGLSNAESIAIPGLYYYDDLKAAVVFLLMFLGGVAFTLLGSSISGIYLNYWWYKQASRLKLNAKRYGLTVKETGVDIFVFRTVMNTFLAPLNLVCVAVSFLIPYLIIWLVSSGDGSGAYVFSSILLFLFALPLMLFGMENTVGSYFAANFLLKNLNRYAEVYRNGAEPFDPMGYEYYPSAENKYLNFLPNFVSGKFAIGGVPTPGSDPDPIPTTAQPSSVGSLVGIKGSCAGYNFELNSGEEIIIGKDAKVSMVVIDPAFKEVSRKHVGVTYDMLRDEYRVVDYSSNGTWANGFKMDPGKAVFLPRGTELRLANDKNIFRLG